VKILFDINHPAHVHLFRNAILELSARHSIIVTASRKEIAFDLLRLYDIPFIDLGTYGNTVLQKMLNVPVMAGKMLRVVQRHQPDVLLGMASSRIAHAAFFYGKKTVILTDTEHAREQIALFKPFATAIVTPNAFIGDLGRRHVRYAGFHELAYLHPNRFSPRRATLQEAGIKPGEIFFVLRFVSWQASHDIGQRGFSDHGKEKLVHYLAQKGKVIISSEAPLPGELEKYRMSISPHKMHDLLSYADLYIGEGGTMAIEAAVLGTPAIFVSTLTAGVLEELEKTWRLLYMYQDEEKAFQKVREWIHSPKTKLEWRQKRENMLRHKVDVTQFIVDFTEKTFKNV
jgi:uncharacterized protein